MLPDIWMTCLNLIQFKPLFRPDSRPSWPCHVALGFLSHPQVAKHIDGQLIVAAEFLPYGSFNSQVPLLIPGDGPCSWVACIDLHLRLHPPLNSCVLSFFAGYFLSAIKAWRQIGIASFMPLYKDAKLNTAEARLLGYDFLEQNSIWSYQIWELPKTICLTYESLYSLHEPPLRTTERLAIASISSKWCDPRMYVDSPALPLES